MSCDDLTMVVPADPDSHFRLLKCGCGSDQGAYVQTMDGLWRVRCFDCGRTSAAGHADRHGAQVEWNREARYATN